MATKVGINGFGRIGRLVFRAMEKDPAFDIVAINDPGSTEANAHLLKYDSIHGRVYDDVKVEGDNIIVDGHKVRVFGDREPLNIPWGEMGVELVIDLLVSSPMLTWLRSTLRLVPRRFLLRHLLRTKTSLSLLA